MLNYLWAGMILTGIIYAAVTGRIPDITNAAIDSSREAVTLCITMMGVISLWSGLMEIASRAGVIEIISGKLRPVLKFLYPELPPGHPALYSSFSGTSSRQTTVSTSSNSSWLRSTVR